MAAAGGLFHNLGSFAPSVLQPTYLRQGVVISLPSATHDISDPLERRFFSGSTWCMETPNKLHVAMVREGGAGNQYLLRMGKHVGPAPVARKRRHDLI